jgi:hypothetical protein
MRFEVYGGFQIQRNPNARTGCFNRAFWDGIPYEGLRKACGCYLFALQNGNNICPWYVGKTERQTFEKECFARPKISYYNSVLESHNGMPLLFLVPRLTAAGQAFSHPTRTGYRDIDFLEAMLISMALKANSGLINIQKTTLLRSMIVPGVVNSPQGNPGRAVRDLRNALGLNQTM